MVNDATTQWARYFTDQYRATRSAPMNPALPTATKLAIAERVLEHSPAGAQLLASMRATGRQVQVVPDARWPAQHQSFWGVSSQGQTWIRESVLNDPVSAAFLIAHETRHALDHLHLVRTNGAWGGFTQLAQSRINAWTEINAFTAEARVAAELGIPLQYAGTGLPPGPRPLQDKAANPYTGTIRSRQETLQMLLADPRYDEETSGVQPWEQL